MFMIDPFQQVLNLDLFENGCYVLSANRTTEAVSYGLILLYEACANLFLSLCVNCG